MKIIFWNINSKDKSDDKSNHKMEAAIAIEELIKKESPDILILAECQDIFYELLKTKITGYNYKNPDIDLETKLNIRVLTKQSIIVEEITPLLLNSIQEKNEGSGRVSGNNLKVGLLLTAYPFIYNSDPISIIASHWPYKGVMGYENLHKKISEELKERSEVELNKGRQVILLGDYNKTTSEMLNNTCLDISMNKYYVDVDRYRFYDLSQHLYTQHSSHEATFRGYGTYVCKTDKRREVSCSVLDHIYVSSNFINNGNWLINEDRTRTIFNEKIGELMYSKSSDLDHLPISLEIEKWK